MTQQQRRKTVIQGDADGCGRKCRGDLPAVRVLLDFHSSLGYQDAAFTNFTPEEYVFTGKTRQKLKQEREITHK